MKRCILLISILLICLQDMAQVREFQINAYVNSIIRSVDDENVLIYTQPTVDTGCFILYKKSDNTALAFNVPNKWEVHDVRIYNGVDAYFCGTNGSSGLIGMFDISQMLSGTVSLNYAIINNWSQIGYVLPTDLKRLDLFEDNGVVNMAMVGTSLWYYWSQVPNTMVMSAYLSGTTWHWRGYPNKCAFMKFTDLACLDEIIVTVGTGKNGDSCYMKTFEKVQNFPGYPIDIGSIIGVTYYNPKGDVLVTHKDGNIAVLAQFNGGINGIGTAFHEVKFSPLTGLPSTTLIDTWRSTPPSTQPFGAMWRMLELNWDVDKAWLLQKAEYNTMSVSGIADWLLKVPVGAPVVMADLYNPHMCNAQSMDLASGKHFPWLSGENTRLTVYEPLWQSSEGGCYYINQFAFNYDSAPWETLIYDDDVDMKSEQNTTEDLPVFEVEVILTCE